MAAHHGHLSGAVGIFGMGLAAVITFRSEKRRREAQKEISLQQETMRCLLARHPGKQQQLNAIAKDGYELSEADAELQSDEEVVKMALLKSGTALQFAAKELRADPSLVKIAVAQDGYALQFANGLSDDREVVKVACAQNGYALQFASQELQSDLEVVMIAVSQVPYAFQHASEALRSDASIVKKVVGKRGTCLQFASEALRKDREIVRKAVANDCNAIRYASEELVDADLQRVAKKSEERNVRAWACLMTMGKLLAMVQKIKGKFSGQKIEPEIDRKEEAQQLSPEKNQLRTWANLPSLCEKKCGDF